MWCQKTGSLNCGSQCVAHAAGVFLDRLQRVPGSLLSHRRIIPVNAGCTRRRCHGYSRNLSSTAASSRMFRDWAVQVLLHFWDSASCLKMKYDHNQTLQAISEHLTGQRRARHGYNCADAVRNFIFLHGYLLNHPTRTNMVNSARFPHCVTVVTSIL